MPSPSSMQGSSFPFTESHHPSSALTHPSRENGFALVIVLALIVLVLVMVVAFFSQSALQNQISASSASKTSAELLATGAVNVIIGDLKQEIAAPQNSISFEVPDTNPQIILYRPSTNEKAAPSRSGTSDSLVNLVKRSAFSVDFAPGVSGRASNLASDDEDNQRGVSKERWNKPLLMEGKSTIKPTPPSDFTAPDWVYVDRAGQNPDSWSSDMRWQQDPSKREVIMGRYAFAIYNEGGLLDANVAGFPSEIKDTAPDGTGKDQTRGRSAVTYADLTQIGLTQSAIDEFVRWRNAASLSGNQSKNFFNFSTSNPSGFITTESPSASSTQTNRAFVSRQQLIDFFKNHLGGSQSLQDALQYLGTFSRSLDRPSYFPDPDRPKVFAGEWQAGNPGYSTGNVNDIAGNDGFGKDDEFNPAFLKIRVQNDFTRSDGSLAKQDEPLVAQRFPLNRVAWLSYKGPSAEHMSDPVVQGMIRLLGGDPNDPNDAIVQFVSEGTADNIHDLFGLEWTDGPGDDGIGGYWTYDHDFTGYIATLRQVAGDNREPDFFELLKAAIKVGSIGYSNDGIQSNNATGPDAKTRNAQNQEATRTDNQIIQIGANIIDQAWPENYPTQIVFDDAYGVSSFWGKVDLPYFYAYVTLGLLTTEATPKPPASGTPEEGVTSFSSPNNPGRVAALGIPIIWNPVAETPSGSGSAESIPGPSKLRIGISTFTEGRRSEANKGAAFANFYNRLTTCYHVPGSDTRIGYPQSSSTELVRLWNVGKFDLDTGVLELPQPSESQPNTELYFDNNPDLYREPVPLMQNKGGINLSIDSKNIIVVRGGFSQQGIREAGGSKEFLGFYMGSTPQRWSDPSANKTYTVNEFGGNEYGNTISLEYESGGKWIPYQQLMTKDNSFIDGGPVRANAGQAILDLWQDFTGFGQWDPRSRRWAGTGETPIGDFIDDIHIKTYRPTFGPGDAARGIYLGAASKDMVNGTENGNIRCADSSGGRIVRRAAGAFATSAVGMPMATVQGNSSNRFNRPIILHRPFRSVAELGYVFSETPWKDLDFFTPESGDSALLDVFCINDRPAFSPLIAGRVDINTRQSKVLQALLTHASRDECAGTSTESTALLSDTDARQVAEALIERTTGLGSPTQGPYINIADLVGRYSPSADNGAPVPAPYEGFSEDLTEALSGESEVGVKRLRESVIRALSDTTQAGTWNLMIDVIAQVGRFGQSADSLGDFSVSAESRYWVHVAIDRQTGSIIDQQIEVVSE